MQCPNGRGLFYPGGLISGFAKDVPVLDSYQRDPQKNYLLAGLLPRHFLYVYRKLRHYFSGHLSVPLLLPAAVLSHPHELSHCTPGKDGDQADIP
jgi:hypothetical protein